MHCRLVLVSVPVPPSRQHCLSLPCPSTQHLVSTAAKLAASHKEEDAVELCNGLRAILAQPGAKPPPIAV